MTERRRITKERKKERKKKERKKDYNNGPKERK